MKRRIACAGGRSIARAAAVAAPTLALTLAVASAAIAQTLTEPNSPTQRSAPHVAAKPRPSENVKSCSAFGAGFVNIPGTDTCIKIGGWVSTESTVRH